MASKGEGVAPPGPGSRACGLGFSLGKVARGPHGQGMAAGARAGAGDKGASPRPLLSSSCTAGPQPGPWAHQRWLTGWKVPGSEAAPVTFSQAPSEPWEGVWSAVSSERDSIIANAWKQQKAVRGSRPGSASPPPRTESQAEDGPVGKLGPRRVALIQTPHSGWASRAHAGFPCSHSPFRTHPCTILSAG